MHELHSGGPILVHCSAGIGRTGTLITLDIVLGSIERDLKFDIHQIVSDLRRQRPGMIQTKVCTITKFINNRINKGDSQLFMIWSRYLVRNLDVAFFPVLLRVC